MSIDFNSVSKDFVQVVAVDSPMPGQPTTTRP